MKKWIFLILAGTLSCGKNERAQVLTTRASEEKTEWFTYEGRGPLNDKQFLYLELSMQRLDENGNGQFELNEFLEEGEAPSSISSFEGAYTTLFGQSPGESIIQFHSTALSSGLKRSYLAPGFRGSITDSRLTMIREEPFRTRDLVVRVSGPGKLIVLDDQRNVVSDEPEHNLVKSLSMPFSIEGYFRTTAIPLTSMK